VQEYSPVNTIAEAPRECDAPEVIQRHKREGNSSVSEKDTLFEDTVASVRDFVFDERVVRVFPDMIGRSVPGYGLVLQMIGLVAHRYVQPESSVYDLGCSLGAATLAMRQAVDVPGVRFVAVDNSAAMIRQCRQVLRTGDNELPVELLEEDVCRVEVRNASMSVLNFTLQFVEPRERLGLLERIARGTRPGGVLVLSEKIRFSLNAEQELQTALYHDFKRAQGYSELEIARKRNALERVLQPDTEAVHRKRLKAAGWTETVRCFQSFNFACYLAFR
jgi:tRNA (cmo5U34)-methyltransferase